MAEQSRTHSRQQWVRPSFDEDHALRVFCAIDDRFDELLKELGIGKDVPPAVQQAIDDLSILILYSLGFQRAIN